MYANRRPITSGLFAVVLLLCLQSSGSKAGEQGSLDDAIRKQAKTISLDLGKDVKIDLVLIPSGSFTMGDANGLDNEKPAHKVSISKPFYMGKYEVTQSQWEAVMGNNPSNFKGASNPVENVSWKDCQAFLGKLDEKFGKFAVKFRLPTEAQWEYACRAGGTGKYGFGDAEASLGEYAWFEGDSTHPVGEKKPNAWGLYDMHGNVWEWCADWHDAGYYKQSPATDPVGPSSGFQRVLRGGSWGFIASVCRAAVRGAAPPSYRGSYSSYVGLRVVCVR